MLKIARKSATSSTWQHFSCDTAHLHHLALTAPRQWPLVSILRPASQRVYPRRASRREIYTSTLNEGTHHDQGTKADEALERYKAEDVDRLADNKLPYKKTAPSEDQSRHYLKDIAGLLPSKIDFKRIPSLRPRITKSPRKDISKIENLDVERLKSTTDHPYNDWRTAFEILRRTTGLPSKRKFDSKKQVYRNVAWHGRRDHQPQIVTPPRKPNVWTESSFMVYIQALVRYEPLPKLLYEPLLDENKKGQLLTRNHQIGLIEDVFYQPYLRNCVSLEAGESALQFLCGQARLREARALFLRLEHLFGDLPISTWNVILRASASDRNLYSFTFQLEKMVRRRISPSPETWISLLMLLTSADAKRQVLDAMRANGLMHEPQTRRAVASQLCLEDYHAHYELESNPQSFFDFMDQQYQCDWASTSTVNKLMGELLLRPTSGPKIAALYRALILLHQMKQRAFTANGVTMDIFLNSLLQIGREELIVEVLGIFRRDWRLEPDRQAHWRLFEYGWRRRKYNFLRSVWVSACLKGFTTSWMRYLVLRSMMSYKISCPDEDAGEKFRRTIGWFLTSIYMTESLASMIRPGEDLVPPYLCYLALRSNIATFGQGRLQRPLATGLQRALEIDSNWDFLRALSVPQNSSGSVQRDHIAIVKRSLHRRTGKRSINRLRQRLRQKMSRITKATFARACWRYTRRRDTTLRVKKSAERVHSHRVPTRQRRRSWGYRFRQRFLVPRRSDENGTGRW